MQNDWIKERVLECLAMKTTYRARSEHYVDCLRPNAAIISLIDVSGKFWGNEIIGCTENAPIPI